MPGENRLPIVGQDKQCEAPRRLGRAAHHAAGERAALAVAKLAGRALLRAQQLPATEPLDPYDRRSIFALYFAEPLGAAAPLLELAALTGTTAPRAAAEALLDKADADDLSLWPAYLAARPWLPGDRRAQFDAALMTALPQMLSRATDNHSLGRGALGPLDLLRSAAAALGDSTLEDLTARHAAAVLADMRQNGPRSGAPLGVNTPGLLVGLAGIGYGLLRLAAPATVPSPLMAAARGG